MGIIRGFPSSEGLECRRVLWGDPRKAGGSLPYRCCIDVCFGVGIHQSVTRLFGPRIVVGPVRGGTAEPVGISSGTTLFLLADIDRSAEHDRCDKFVVSDMEHGSQWWSRFDCPSISRTGSSRWSRPGHPAAETCSHDSGSPSSRAATNASTIRRSERWRRKLT